MKDKNIFYTKCENCENIFEHHTKRIRKFCSKQCRETHWKKNNYERYMERVKVGYLKYKKDNPIVCKKCGEEVPDHIRGCGKVFCSDECREATKKQKTKSIRELRQKKFNEFKLSLGCSHCGYKRCPGCLDFHHIDPEFKEMRITASMWSSQGDKIKEEIKKCVLLCKNCHYEKHFSYEDLKIEENGDVSAYDD